MKIKKIIITPGTYTPRNVKALWEATYHARLFAITAMTIIMSKNMVII